MRQASQELRYHVFPLGVGTRGRLKHGSAFSPCIESLTRPFTGSALPKQLRQTGCVGRRLWQRAASQQRTSLCGTTSPPQQTYSPVAARCLWPGHLVVLRTSVTQPLTTCCNSLCPACCAGGCRGCPGGRDDRHHPLHPPGVCHCARQAGGSGWLQGGAGATGRVQPAGRLGSAHQVRSGHPQVSWKGGSCQPWGAGGGGAAQGCALVCGSGCRRWQL